ncbi:hypothetical protein [Methylobacterium frigidaeris]|uniref:Uncharacterized protein n=1 Tax=Methylobacterium frigidaeris TaxID=2038277 RepID=A0AA37HD52_9HYPH|nr:hypothetical protein [Methylobacterium frigidaeris]GJD63781.1 hypothetical protein MPEAHAMD_3952 [Methylobacterium frigidaeris]
MHRSLNILDAELVRHRALNAAPPTELLPHLAAQHYRAQRDRRDTHRIPHIDADARLRAARNELAAGLDHLIANAALAAGAVAALVGLCASAQVVALFVGGVL